ncbi:probable palmitoyltransferase ZDHHC24 [Epargyreus clarus]|uniref:probable palmitoyltransferase ZDHHC24 n=1 Tax=Epargyreus clarus TaxID=520877 RepID=UPI003C2ABA97
MLIQFESMQNGYRKRFTEHIFYMALVFLLVPGFFFFELCIVLPAVCEEWTVSYFIHYFCATFLLFNILGNLIYGMFTNTSIKGRYLGPPDEQKWTMCPSCECLRPPRAWHCNICNICILKRDHHCTFFACCVGYFNHRYFILFTLYIFLSMLYSFYYNIKFLAQFVTWNHGLVLVKFVFPLASFVVDFCTESLYVFLVVINVVVGAFSGFLFLYHFNNILKGRVTPERKLCEKEHLYNKGWHSNIVEVFGARWYLTWISPFIVSPLPGNGVEWAIEDKYN